MNVTPSMQVALDAVSRGGVLTWVDYRRNRESLVLSGSASVQSLRALLRRKLVVAEAGASGPQTSRRGHYVAWRITTEGRKALWGDA